MCDIIEKYQADFKFGQLSWAKGLGPYVPVVPKFVHNLGMRFWTGDHTTV